MSEPVRPLLVVTTSKSMSKESAQQLTSQLNQVAKPLGMEALLLSDGLQAGVHADLRPLMEKQLAQQTRTNELLVALIEALGEEGGEVETVLAHDLSGRPIRLG